MIFLDTNVFGYAFLSQDARKKEHAMTLVYQALKGNDYAISTQVVSETLNLLLKKASFSYPQISRCQHILEHIPTIVLLTVPLIRRASEIKAIYGLQLYDAQIMAAAEHCNAALVLSEDMANRQCYGNVTCMNPFDEEGSLSL